MQMEENATISFSSAKMPSSSSSGTNSTTISPCPSTTNPILRLRSSTVASSNSASSSILPSNKQQNLLIGFISARCSPFVSLTILSALVLLVVPNEYFYAAVGPNLAATMEAEEEFSCGGGPFSYYAASLISISCDRQQIHLCCEVHDRCYDQVHLNQTYCDDQFCGCLDTIQTSAYCETIAQPGLCLATRVFGHLFYLNANGTDAADGRLTQQENAGEMFEKSAFERIEMERSQNEEKDEK